MSPTRVSIELGDPRHPEATALLEASHALMQSLFPAEANHYLSIDALCGPDIRFFVAELNGVKAGCGALALREGYGEVKSMFVDPAMRGGRIGSRLLERIEAEAKAHQLPFLRLETGDKLTAAHKLYSAHGFVLRGPFGDYPDEPTSLFMEKDLRG
jgi:putative acetyltransferase